MIALRGGEFFSRNIMEAIKNAGGTLTYTEYPAELNYDHASWVPAYENKEMIEWVFEQEKEEIK